MLECLLARQRVVGGQQRDALLGVERHELEPALVDRQVHEGDVGGAVEQDLRLV